MRRARSLRSPGPPPTARINPRLEELRQAPGGASGAVGLHVAIVDVAADLLRNRCRDQLRRGVVEIHAATGPVPLEPVADVEVLLEVMAEREVDEWPLLGGQLH